MQRTGRHRIAAADQPGRGLHGGTGEDRVLDLVVEIGDLAGGQAFRAIQRVEVGVTVILKHL
jgi:hypothetical protein